MKAAVALAAIKEAAETGFLYVGTGDMVFALLRPLDAKELVEAAANCTDQGNDWVIEVNGARLVVRLEGRVAVVVGYQVQES